MNFRDSLTWRRTLADQGDADVNREARTFLRERLVQLRSRVEPLAKEIALSVPNYTDHSVTHCDALWDICDLILPEDFPLNPAEAFVLGGAFLVHDLGMGLAAYQEGLAGILKSEQWMDLLASRHPAEYRELQEQALQDVAANPTWDGLSGSAVKATLTIYLREHHAEQAESILTEHWKLTNGEDFYLLEDSELRHWYGMLIGRIGRSHWQDVDSLPELFPQQLGALARLAAPAWTINALKLACILRIADAAQIDARRADPMHTPFRLPQGESMDHWKFQERLLYPQVHEGRLVYTSSESFAMEMANAWWLCFDSVRMIDTELRKVDALFADLGMHRFEARSVAGAEEPGRFAKYVPTGGWDPIDARPVISDPDSIIKSLGGKALYGTRGITALRELLANAVDATRLLESAYGSDEVRAVEVRISEEDEADVLTVEDFGIGMTATEVIRYLCDFGTSGWTSHSTRAGYPGALAAGYRSTGQFGIGFYSSFMVADEVSVVTRSVTEGAADTVVLHFAEGLNRRPIMRRADRSERRLRPGTKVSLKLRARVNESEGIFEHSDRSDLHARLLRSITKLALLCDEPVKVSGFGHPAEACELVGKNWLDLPEGELAAMLVDTTATQDDPLAVTAEQQEELVAEIARRLAPIYDASGAVVGRAGLAVGLPHNYHSLVHSCTVYCGGFEGGHIFNAVGILTGQPETAARNTAKVGVGRQESQRWLAEQISLVDSVSLRPDDRLQLAGMLVEARMDPGELPVAYTSRGPLSTDDFKQLLEKSDEVTLYEDVFDVTDVEGGRLVFSAFAGNALVEVPENVVLPTLVYSTSLLPTIDAKEHVDPRDELGQEACKVGDGLDLHEYWRSRSTSLLGHLLRVAAAYWGLSLRQLLLQAQWNSRRSGSPLVTLKATNGVDVRVPAVTIRRQIPGY